VLRLHGLSRDAWERFRSKRVVFSDAIALGFKYNLTDLQAALGIHQLAKLPRFQERREQLAARYDSRLAELPGVSIQPRSLPGHTVRHALHLYLLLLDLDRFGVERNDIVAALRAENVGAAIHYRALHLEPYFVEAFGHRPGDFPVAAAASDRVLTLPLFPAMSDEDADDVLDAVERVVTRYAR
jgi:dTDP-4-amino-4,6-dideoxygalactose transaminase